MLKKDGTVWLNLGDSYTGGCNIRGNNSPLSEKQASNAGATGQCSEHAKNIRKIPGLKPKDLVGIPWRVAFALQKDGWYLRSDIIWCLSGGTWLYVKTQKGEMPMMVKDIARLDPKTVKLWNGEKWTQLLGMSCSQRKGNEIELVLRSGERISCTPSHKFPTQRGLLEARDIKVGDVLISCTLPEPEMPKDCVIDEDAAWLAGLYLAEGSMSGDTIQIAGHIKETERWQKLQNIAKKYGGSITRTIDGNKMDIRMYGKVLVAIIQELIHGRTAKDKHFAPVVWQYSNKFIQALLEGYLSGDGYYDKSNNRWRVTFTRNYHLERDLRVVCARLGWHLVLKPTFVKYKRELRPIFRGEIRATRNGHWNEKNPNEVVEIRKARCRKVWDLGVADEPHLFSLASGVLTHNSKPNPMPESVTDRPTKAHEYIFLLAKSQKYYYDNEAIKEKAVEGTDMGLLRSKTEYTNGKKVAWHSKTIKQRQEQGIDSRKAGTGKRNKRSVWTINTKPYPEAHFATFPPELPETCIKAGCPKGGVVMDPFGGSGTTNYVAEKLGRNSIYIDLNEEYLKLAIRRMGFDKERLFDCATYEVIKVS